MPLEHKFDTFSTYMSRALYSKYGYYSSGSVLIEDKNHGGHFTTLASRSSSLGLVIANYMHLTFKHQIENNKRSLDTPTPFIVVELSGGHGILAHTILTCIQALAKKQIDFYEPLWQVLSYTTYEISPELAKQQVSKNEVFIKNNKYHVCNESALNIKESSIDVCFSNEFWDALAFDYIKKTDDGQVLIKVCLPYITENYFQQLMKDNIIVSNRDNLLAELTAQCTLPTIDNHVPFDMVSFEKKQALCESKEEWLTFLNTINWQTVWVPVALFPSIDTILQSQHAYLACFETNIEYQISMDLIRMANKLASIKPYFSIHFDYGEASKGAVRFPARYYPCEDYTAPTNTFNFQTNVDITSTVDFYLLASVISENNLSDCLCNYNALACIIVKDIEKTAFNLKEEKLGLLPFDFRDFCFINTSFKFLAHSKFINLKQLKKEPLYMGAETPEDFLEHPLNPINYGIPLEREFKSTTKEKYKQCYALQPKADRERLSSFVTIYLYKLIHQQAIKEKLNWGKKQYQQFTEYKNSSPSNPAKSFLFFSVKEGNMENEKKKVVLPSQLNGV